MIASVRCVFCNWFSFILSQTVNHAYQQTFICSKSTIQTLGKGTKYVKNKNKDARATSTANVVLMSLMLTLNIFHTFF